MCPTPCRWLSLTLLFVFLLFGSSPRGQAQGGCVVQNTPYFSEYKGNLTLDGQAAPVGAMVEAYNGAGVRTGCIVSTIPGIYPFLRVYGADSSTGTPGMAANEAIIFKVNGAVATSNPASVPWSGNPGPYDVNLSAVSLPAAVATLDLERTETGLKLTWSHVGGGVTGYEVWRSNKPYFTPGAPGSQRLAANVPAPGVPGAVVEFPNPAHPNPADFYLVLSLKNGQTSPVSNGTAVFDFSLTPGSS